MPKRVQTTFCIQAVVKSFCRLPTSFFFHPTHLFQRDLPAPCPALACAGSLGAAGRRSDAPTSSSEKLSLGPARRGWMQRKEAGSEVRGAYSLVRDPKLSDRGRSDAPTSSRWRGTFSLIELALIVSLLLVLSAFFVPQFYGVRDRAARQKTLVSLKQMGKAMAMYRSEDTDYPPAGFPLTSLEPYTDISVHTKHFNLVELTDVAGARCLAGTVKDLTPLYWVTFCPEPPGATEDEQGGTKQPTCSWDGGTTWYPCERKM